MFSQFDKKTAVTMVVVIGVALLLYSLLFKRTIALVPTTVSVDGKDTIIYVGEVKHQFSLGGKKENS
jgi:hypothetical protein